MPVDKIRRGAAPAKTGFPNANSVRVHTDNTVRVGVGTSGSSENQLVDTTTAQTLTNKTLTNPVINGQQAGVAAAAGAVTDLIVSKVLTDNTATDFATVTVPNVIAGAGITLEVATMLGDGDSAQMSLWDIAVARIAGAATAATVSSVGVSATKNGATGNAVTTVTCSGMTGGVGATQTFTIQIKNARSAGAADNHPMTAAIRLINLKAAGVTIAAA